MPFVNDVGAVVNDPRWVVNDPRATTAPKVPIINFDVAFDTKPMAVTPVWTSLADRFASASTRYGRQDETQEVQPGTATYLLDNSDRALDPGHAGSPHAGKLVPGKRCRLWAVFEGVTYDLFHSFADGWPSSWLEPEVGEVALSTTDAFQLLSGRKVDSPYAAEVRKDSPRAWWRLGDGTITATDSSGNRYDGTFGGKHTDGLLSGDDDQAAEFEGQAGAFPAGSTPTSLPMAVEFWIQTRQDPVFIPGNVVHLIGIGDALRTRISLFDRGRIQVTDGTNVGYNSTEDEVNDGSRHHVVCNMSTTVNDIYVDGVRANGILSAVSSKANGPLFIGAASNFAAFAGVLDEVAVYNDVLPVARIQAHHEAGSNGWKLDRSDQRIDRLLDQRGWPEAWRSLGQGSTRLGEVSEAGEMLGDIKAVERTEAGTFYVDHSTGYLAFRGRHAYFLDARSSDVQLTLSDEDAPGALHYSDPETSNGEGHIVNEVTVRWQGGEVTRRDETSIDDYGPQPRSIDTLFATRGEAEDRAAWELRGAQPQQRVVSVTLLPSAESSSALWHAALGVRVGDRVNLRRHPLSIGAASTFDLIVEGVARHIDAATRTVTVTLNLSPRSSTTYWRLGTDALDTTARLSA